MEEIDEIEKIVSMMRASRVLSLKTPKFEIVLDVTSFSTPFDEQKNPPKDDDDTLFWSSDDTSAYSGAVVSGGINLNV